MIIIRFLSSAVVANIYVSPPSFILYRLCNSSALMGKSRVDMFALGYLDEIFFMFFLSKCEYSITSNMRPGKSVFSSFEV